MPFGIMGDDFYGMLQKREAIQGPTVGRCCIS